MEEFIGIVRGRTVNSTRGRRTAQPPEPSPDRKPARRQAGGKQAGGKSAGKAAPGPSGGAAQRKGGAPAARRGKPRRRS